MGRKLLLGGLVDLYATGLESVMIGWGANVVYFSNNRDRAVQSFNRSLEDIYTMAAKLKKAVASGKVERKEFVWNGFINVSLTADQKEAYRAWDIEDTDVWDGIAQYAVAGVKIQMSYNKQNDKFNCTGTGQPESGANSGYAISAFGNSPYNAARVWLYKVSAVVPDVWTEYEGAADDDIG